jgi:hypothetical protein
MQEIMNKTFLIKTLGFLTLVLSLGACNFFNPSGEGELNSANEIISYGESLYRDTKFSEAAKQFEKAIALDSTKSRAYYGLAKARLRQEGVNPFVMVGLIDVPEGEIPFVNESAATKNIYYRGSRAVVEALAPLVHRDTLHDLRDLVNLIDAGSIDEDSLYTADSTYRNSIPHYRLNYEGKLASKLTDKEITFSRISIDWTLTSFISWALDIFDTNSDGFINDSDFNLTITKDETGKLEVDMNEVFAAAQSDPTVATDMNAKIEALASGTADLNTVLAGLTGTQGQEGLAEETDESLEQQIDDLGQGILFYKIGDGIDNDGDGCIDEELYDSLDNDLDGFIDEDVRLFPIDGLDNNGDGQADQPNELIAVRPSLVFTTNFIANSKGELNATSKDDKLAVAQDTTGTQFNLSQRQALIGGCWGFYNQARFDTYIANKGGL